MPKCRKLLTAIAVLLATQFGHALESGEPDPLFQDDSVVEITITAPMKTLLGERPDDHYLRGTISHADASGRVLRLYGRLDAKHAQSLVQQCQELLDQDVKNVVITMSDVTFVASSGVGTVRPLPIQPSRRETWDRTRPICSAPRRGKPMTGFVRRR